MLYTSGCLRNRVKCGVEVAHSLRWTSEVCLLSSTGIPWFLFLVSALHAVSCREEKSSCSRQQRTVNHDLLIWTSLCFFFSNLYFSGLCHSHIPKLKDRSPIVCIPAASPPLSILCLCSPGLWQSLAGWHVSPGSLPSQIWPQCWFNTRSQFKGDEVYFIERVWYQLLTPETLFPCGLPRKTTPAVFHKSCYRKGLRGVPARVDWPPT